MSLKKRFRFLYVSVERANCYVRKFIRLSQKQSPGILIKVRKCILRNTLHRKYNIIIGDECKIDSCPVFPHPQNIIIGSGSRIGHGCTIYQDVTIGQNRGMYPVIGSEVIIYSGVKIIGPVNVGKGSIIGANAVVTTDIPENAIVGGIPAKVIRLKGADDVLY